MKIEWTDAACDALAQAYRASPYALIGKDGHRRPLAREMLNAATAEQFRPETDAEKVKRLEAALTRLRVRSVPGSEFDHIITEALAGPNRKET